MRQKYSMAVVIGGVLLASSLVAQDSPSQVVFSAYYKCDQGREGRADEIINEVVAPILERQVSAGQLSTWGWLAHTMGGEWRRLLFTLGTDRDAMFDARGQLIQDINQNNARAMEEFGDICPTHDDYIWSVVVNSGGDEGPAANASLSAYHVCDLTRQARTRLADNRNALIVSTNGESANQFAGQSNHITGT